MNHTSQFRKQALNSSRRVQPQMGLKHLCQFACFDVVGSVDIVETLREGDGTLKTEKHTPGPVLFIQYANETLDANDKQMLTFGARKKKRMQFFVF